MFDFYVSYDLVEGLVCFFVEVVLFIEVDLVRFDEFDVFYDEYVVIFEDEDSVEEVVVVVEVVIEVIECEC